ncbi:MAG: right-handed parallel beta-helix repeat-containing protein, partial [Spirochaetes bacterium]|nr:right-handed parallel beta-helix repeat-containing protein [Spirochaetota bacterium]
YSNYMTATSNGLYITGQSNLIYNNRIKHNNYGLNIGTYMGGEPQYNIIVCNEICSNITYGIFLGDEKSDNNIILSNDVYGQQAGIYIVNGDKNIISGKNKIHNNDLIVASAGIRIAGTGNSNYITNNLIYSNQGHGIWLMDRSSFNLVRNNRIWANWNFGITFWSGDCRSNIIMNNLIERQGSYGLYIVNATNNIFTQNIIRNQSIGGGILSQNGKNNKAFKNIITNNYKGIMFSGGLPQQSLPAFLNNIYHNTDNIDNSSGNAFKISNNWWGSTASSNILRKMNLGAGIDFTPYRLFGPFDTSEGSDTTTPQIITGITKYQTNQVTCLRWNRSSAGDLDHYNMYVSSSPAFSNLSSGHLKVRTAQTDSVIPMAGRGYVHLTASDNYPVYTNESWYSTVTAFTNPHIICYPQYLSDYQTTRNRDDQVILAFQYINSSNYSMTNFAVSNRGNMQQGVDLDPAIKLYHDAGTIGVYNPGIDTFITNLFYSSFQNKWTNTRLSVTNKSRILVTMDILSSPTISRTFQVQIKTLQDTHSQPYTGSVPGPTVTIDDMVPVFAGNFSAELANGSVVLNWDHASDNVTPQAGMLYNIYKEPVSGSTIGVSTPAGSVTGNNTITLSGLGSGAHYFLIEAVDEMGNKTTNPKEASIVMGRDDLNALIVGPNPFKPTDNKIETGTLTGGITFSGLTSQVTIEIYTVNGILIDTLHEKDGDGIYNWVPEENMASGVYLARVSNDKGEKKVVKIMVIK